MSDDKEKLSSNEVPDKFSEWLLAMGCPPDRVPCLDNAKEMCRGQYYIVWRSLMEEVEPKDSIKYKRQLVFYNDMLKYHEKNGYHEGKASVIVPDELSLWQEHTDLKHHVTDAEAQMLQARDDLKHLIDKVSSKLAHRNTSRRHTQDTERRVQLLQKVAQELQAKKSDLQETMTIANSLFYVEENVDIESKLDKYLTIMRRQNYQSASQSLPAIVTPMACSSIASTNSDIDCEEQLSCVVRCGGGALWAAAGARRAARGARLAAACAPPPAARASQPTAKCVLAHTRALHCTVALEAMKNKSLIRQAQRELTDTITQLNEYLTGDPCEYLVIQCERTRAQSRVDSLRTCLEMMTSRSDVFACGARQSRDKNTSRRQISNIDKAIITKREELKRVLRCLATTERKILNVRECLRCVFNCLQNRMSTIDMDRFKGQIFLPQESLSTLQQFYDERRVINKKKLDLSLDLDVSGNNSYIECTENDTPKFIDELKIYLNKFNMENNRKLVLESGEKIWIFETLQSSLERVYTKWQTEEAWCSVLCPSVTWASSLQRLACDVTRASERAERRGESEKEIYPHIDVTSHTALELETTDKLKKRLNDNLNSLEKINRALDLGSENLQFWASNTMGDHISANRTVDGKTYKEYEKCYFDSFR